jgi:hypothetical protein
MDTQAVRGESLRGPPLLKKLSIVHIQASFQRIQGSVNEIC